MSAPQQTPVKRGASRWIIPTLAFFAGIVIVVGFAVGLVGRSTGTVTSAAAAAPAAATTAPAAGRQTSAVGGGWEVTIGGGGAEVMMYSAQWLPDTGGPGASTPRNGAYLVMDVGIDVTKGSLFVSEYDWKAKDADGRTWSCTSSHWFDPGLPTETVAAGDKVRGNVVCDLPQTPVTVFMDQFGWTVPA